MPISHLSTASTLTQTPKPMHRSITSVIDHRNGEAISRETSALLDPLSAEEVSLLRADLTTAHDRGRSPITCSGCGGALYLSTRAIRQSAVKDGRRTFFVHRASANARTCPMATRASRRPDAVDAARFDGQQEGLRHIAFKLGLTAMLESDPSFDAVAVERAVSNEGQRRTPDVQALGPDGPVAFEVQLATPQITTMLERARFYAGAGYRLVWIVDGDAGNDLLLRQGFQDIVWIQGGQILALDDTCLAEAALTGRAQVLHMSVQETETGFDITREALDLLTGIERVSALSHDALPPVATDLTAHTPAPLPHRLEPDMTTASHSTSSAPAWTALAERALDRILPGRRAARGVSLKEQLVRMRQSATSPEGDMFDEPEIEDRLEALVTDATAPPTRPALPPVPPADPTILDWDDLPEELTGPTLPRPCLAETLTPAAIDDLIAKGDDPWAVNVHTGLYRPDLIIDPRKALVIARLCAACGDQDGIDRLVGAEAAAVVLCETDAEAAALEEALREGVRAAPADLGIGRPTPPMRPHLVKLTATTTSALKADQARAFEALASPRPVVVLTTDLSHLTGALRQLPVLALAPMDREIVLFTLRETLSAAGRIAETAVRAALPDDRALAAMPTDTLLLGLRAKGPIRAARRLAELAAAPVARGTEDDGPRLRDLPGLGAAATQLAQLVADAAAYRTGDLPWSDLPNGLVLAGAPGTGKTTVAAALARSLEVPFFPATLVDWQKTGGKGSCVIEAMAATFAEARAAAKTCGLAIVFLDEIDSLGSRDRPHDHNSTYFTNVLNGLLAELDGSVGREGVIVIGATNYPEALDPALARPGRLGTRVSLDNPPASNVAEVIRYHLGDAFAVDNLDRIARAAAGSSMAELMDLVQAAKQAARAEERPITEDDLFVALARTRLPVPDALRKRIAIHEAGHAVAAHVTGSARPESVTLSGANGEVRMRRRADARSRADITAELVAHLAGRAAEEVFLDTVSGGGGGDTQSDLAQATRLAIAEALSYGHGSDLVWSASEDDPATLFACHRGLRDRVAGRLDGAYARALRLVRENHDAVTAIAGHLRVDGTVTGETLTDLLGYCVRTERDDGDEADAHRQGL